jgi:transposase
MPQPIPMPVRQQIWSRCLQGQDASTIARALGLCPRTVQQLVQRFRQGGQEALPPGYHAPRLAASSPEHLVREAVFLHQEHPSWGAGFIRVRLQLRHPTLTIPSERTLQRWCRHTRLPPAPSGRRPIREQHPAHRPHGVWQMDASERIRLATGASVSWLRSVDEFTGAVLSTRVFPLNLLESGAPPRNPTLLAPAISPLGAAPSRARRQWPTLGQLE